MGMFWQRVPPTLWPSLLSHPHSQSLLFSSYHFLSFPSSFFFNRIVANHMLDLIATHNDHLDQILYNYVGNG